MSMTFRWVCAVVLMFVVMEGMASGQEKQAGQAEPKLILNCTEWKDTQGRMISAHEHFVGRFDKVFYWYGTSYKGNPSGRCGEDGAALLNGFNVYRSKNLVDWEYLGECLKFPKDAAKGPGGSWGRGIGLACSTTRRRRST